MEYITKISPAIPTLRKVQRHVEKQFKTNSRGSHHGTPDKEKDVTFLSAQYTKSQLYRETPGRQIKISGDRAVDVSTTGAVNLERLNTIGDWFDRRSPKRSIDEIWEEIIPGGG
jgi:hypothetical protein